MSQVEQILDTMRNGDWDTAVRWARNLPAESFSEIAALLEQRQDTRERQLCYSILTHVAVSSCSTAIGTYAAKRVEIETNTRLIREALEVAAWTRGITDYQPILHALGNKNQDVRRWAIRALGACHGKEAEDALLTTLREASKPGLADLAAGALARMCGPTTIQEIVALFPQLPRQPAVQSTLEYLIFALARHPQPSCTELVRNELDSTRLWGAGWSSLNYLFHAGDPGDEGRVARYLGSVFQRLKRGALVYTYSLLHVEAAFHTEVTAALATLRRFAADPISPWVGDIQALWEALSFDDHAWLLRTYPDRFPGRPRSRCRSASRITSSSLEYKRASTRSCALGMISSWSERPVATNTAPRPSAHRPYTVYHDL